MTEAIAVDEARNIGIVIAATGGTALVLSLILFRVTFYTDSPKVSEIGGWIFGVAVLLLLAGLGGSFEGAKRIVAPYAAAGIELKKGK